jgi:hypothetical protein
VSWSGVPLNNGFYQGEISSSKKIGQSGSVMDNVSTHELDVTDTPQTLAQALKTTPQTINAWHRSGIIPSVFACGRVIRFNRSQVIAALAAKSKCR